MLPCKKKRGLLQRQSLMRFCQTVAGNGLDTLQRAAMANFVSSINVFWHIAGIGNKLKERFEKVFRSITAADTNYVSTLTICFWSIRYFTAKWIQDTELVSNAARRTVLKGILIPWKILT
jgi:hypothetical protein